jgi:UDP-3-O-[3-hydroxymyristoyl] glucosamine N-acyltransferase
MSRTSAKELSELINGVCSHPFIEVDNTSSISSANKTSVSFYTDKKYKGKLKLCKAGLIILRKEDLVDWPGPSIIVKDPYLAFALAANFLRKKIDFIPYIHPSIIVGKNTKLDKNTQISPFVMLSENVVIEEFVCIGANTTIGTNVSIGRGTSIHSNVTIGNDVRIGANCEIFSGAVIGVDGFGYAQGADEKWIKIPQVGSVIIGDEVDIGANTSIDRGAIDNTIIMSGVKIDNQVQIGHNCVINENTVIAGCVGIAGSAVIGKNCKIGGAAMILGHLSIADNTTISPGTMITKSIKKIGKRYTSITPFLEHRNWLRFAANIKKQDK